MTADDIVALMIPATWFALMAAEAAKPARSWPKMRLWRSRSMVFFTSGSTRSIVGYVSTFYGLFQHANVSTPQWLGVLIQRPESHGVHHRRGVHGYNYADFPLWDMLMGTFRNPRRFDGDVGFDGAATHGVFQLLRGRDANAPTYGPGSRGTQAPNRNPA